MKELFKPYENRDVLHTRPERPLGRFSDFVVAELPRLVTAGDQAGLAKALEERLPELAPLLDAEDPSWRGLDNQSLARVDIQFAFNAAYFLGITDNGLLNALTVRAAKLTGRLPGMRYEDCVLDNPENDLRTLFEGAVGGTEADFYLGHKYIERHLASAIDDVVAAIELCRSNFDQSVAEQLVRDAIAEFDGVIGYMGQLHKGMATEDFNIFRLCLSSVTLDKKFADEFPLLKPDANGDVKVDGASGKDSHRIPTLDLLILGRSLDPAYLGHLDKMTPYFPVQGQTDLALGRQIANEGLSLYDIADNEACADSLRSAILALQKAKQVFRSHHMAAVIHHLPGIKQGTGGEDPIPFMSRIMKQTTPKRK
ncbi:MAG: hypothetical protein UZ21_OP11001000220 [Microgenomates bacterium OLB22]|nr:MAG: hypothetical protein UZ21_OP11001000220 [Microgenomates bacterium OLB22]